MNKKLKILVLGASGMLGYSVMRYFSKRQEDQVFGTFRSNNALNLFSSHIPEKQLLNCDMNNEGRLEEIIQEVNPDVIINCVGVIKQANEANDPEKLITINSLLPHRLSKIALKYNSRIIHISTDCVFSGEKGLYTEDDIPDASEVYGMSKYLGEIIEPHCITLRTSIIGHELKTKNSLVEWFLSQEDECEGYTNAIFSGFPTIVLAEIIAEVIVPMKNLHGIYHVASEPISKYDLLTLISNVYGKKIEIEPNGELIINRSLSADKFHQETGYIAPEWSKMIEAMYSNR